MPSYVEYLKIAFVERAVIHGNFLLASGKKSNYYIDSKQILLNGDALTALGDALFNETPFKMGNTPNTAVGGLEVGAIPMTAAYLIAASKWGGQNPEGFFVRKEPKAHGSKNLIEGRLKAGDKVYLLDDVLTTGGSILKAAAAVEAVGAEVVKVCVICDRLETRQPALDKYDVVSLFTVKDIGITPNVA